MCMKHHRIIIAFLSLLFLISKSVYAQEVLFFKEKFQESHTGDYIVLEESKTYILLNIFEKDEQNIVIEEICIPKVVFSSLNLNWRDWVCKGSPSATSWVMYEIDYQKAEILHYYSFTQESFLDIPHSESLISKLLHLPFTKIPLENRRRIGTASSSYEIDSRRLWKPQAVVEGKVMDQMEFDAWETFWPKDNTELSQKKIEIYLPKQASLGPCFFPYWLQVEGAALKVKIRVVDSGKNLKSFKSYFPKRPMQILDGPKFKEDGLSFILFLPKECLLHLFAEDLSHDKTWLPLSFEMHKIESSQYCNLHIPYDFLNSSLIFNHSYLFHLVSNDPELGDISTLKPFMWKGQLHHQQSNEFNIKGKREKL